MLLLPKIAVFAVIALLLMENKQTENVENTVGSRMLTKEMCLQPQEEDKVKGRLRDQVSLGR